MKYVNAVEFARKKDEEDPLKHFRQEFFIPQHQGKDAIYLAGNSLGLQPRNTNSYLDLELEHWAKLGVKGHFNGTDPWLYYHKSLQKPLASLVGAKTQEVVPMGSLTSNLHLLLVSFYRPDQRRHRILIEAGAFPSDHYAVESHLKLHGFDPQTGIIELRPREGTYVLETRDIISQIETHAEEIALILLPAVQYYTGQLLAIKRIAEAGHRHAIPVGLDLAHAIGNVPLHVHDCEIDFAVWCSYKYLNSGPGATGGLFVHENHHANQELPRMAGWWGHNEATRFQMRPGFEPIKSAEGWQLSNANVMSLACQKASLQLFEEAGGPTLRTKSIDLTGYMEFLLEQLGRPGLFRIITPSNPTERGSQISLLFEHKGKRIFDLISQSGVICDWRDPDVIRLAPVPLYNSFADVFHFGEKFSEAIKTLNL